MSYGTSVRTAPGNPITAKLNVQPRLRVPALPCVHPSGAEAAVFVAAASEVAGFLHAPVSSNSPNRKLTQITCPEWERVLQPWGELDFPLPIVISPRTNWNLSNHTLEVFAEAIIIDGACRLESQLEINPSAQATFVALLGLTAAEELLVRQALYQAESGERISEQKFGTDTPRLKVPTNWITATIESDPFVVPTIRGYAPAILVRRPSVKNAEHILVGAKSLSEPLEEMRLNAGSLIGTEIRIRKSGTAPTAPYEIAPT